MTRADEERLLRQHRLHIGVYKRVADRLELSPSYVSLVMAGKRRSEKIMNVILRELRRIDSR